LRFVLFGKRGNQPAGHIHIKADAVCPPGRIQRISVVELAARVVKPIERFPAFFAANGVLKVTPG